jgi:hypothetical protein
MSRLDLVRDLGVEPETEPLLESRDVLGPDPDQIETAPEVARVDVLARNQAFSNEGTLLLGLESESLEIRMAAARAAASQKFTRAIEVLESMLTDADLARREGRELKVLMTAYAVLAGPWAVSLLARVMSPGLIAVRREADVQTAAALALGNIASEDAHEALKKGLRTLNRRVKDACQRALVRSGLGPDDRRSDPPAPAQVIAESERDRIEEEELLESMGAAAEPRASLLPREPPPMILEPQDRVLGRGFRVLRASDAPARLPSSAMTPLPELVPADGEDPNEQ